MSPAVDRVLSTDAWAHVLEPLPLDPASVVDGTPQSAIAELSTLGEVSIGIWELSEGTVTDVEVDEVFVVLDGVGTVGFEDGPTVDLRRGVAVHLRAGDRTTWTVQQTIRKVFVAPA